MSTVCRFPLTPRCIGCQCQEQPQCCHTLLALGRIDCAASTDDNLAHEAEVRHRRCLLCAILFSQPSYPPNVRGGKRTQPARTLSSDLLLFNLLLVSYVSKLQYFSLLWSTISAAREVQHMGCSQFRQLFVGFRRTGGLAYRA